MVWECMRFYILYGHGNEVIHVYIICNIWYGNEAIYIIKAWE